MARRKDDDPADLTPSVTSAGLDHDQPDYLRNLIDSLPPSSDATQFEWREDDFHPRVTGFRREPGWIVQEPGIFSKPGDLVLLREYVIVREVDGDRVLVDQLIDYPVNPYFSYLVVDHQEEEDAAPQG